MEIRQVEAALIHTDRYDEANKLFSRL